MRSSVILLGLPAKQVPLGCFEFSSRLASASLVTGGPEARLLARFDTDILDFVCHLRLPDEEGRDATVGPADDCTTDDGHATGPRHLSGGYRSPMYIDNDGQWARYRRRRPITHIDRRRRGLARGFVFVSIPGGCSPCVMRNVIQISRFSS